MIEPAIIVHSGAGFFVDERNEEKFQVTKKAARKGFQVLQETGNPVLAVEAAVRVMEDDPSGNAGFGSVLTSEGLVEMDAILIRGSDLATGAVGALKHVRNPISVAKAVMEKSDHVLLVGQGAEDFARNEGFEIVENEVLVSERSLALLEAVKSKKIGASTETGHINIPEKGLGTVGAVAINGSGHLAAATSTGGLCGKLPGRVGDTPIPGGGTYCDDLSCGISATGKGESIMRVCLCSRIASRIEKGEDPFEASVKELDGMTKRVGADAGVILITKDGKISYSHNSKKMTWAWARGKELHYGLEEGHDFVENV